MNRNRGVIALVALVFCLGSTGCKPTPSTPEKKPGVNNPIKRRP